MQIETPYLMFLGDVPDTLAAKTAYGIADWRPEWCVGSCAFPDVPPISASPISPERRRGQGLQGPW